VRLEGAHGPPNGTSNVMHLKDGDWNEIEVAIKPTVCVNTVNGQPLASKDVFGVIVAAGKLTATLNGRTIKLTSVHHSESAEAVCKYNGKLLPPITIPATGPLGILSGTGRFDFRRIRVKEMPPPE
jgi:hypothetical protein